VRLGSDRHAPSLRPHEHKGVLGAEHVAMQVGDPLPPRRRHVQAAVGLLETGRDAVPVEIGIALDQVGRGSVAELAVEADLLGLVEEALASFR